MSEGYGKGGVCFGLTRDQSVEMIVRTCIDNGITDHRQIAYVLATAQHESRDFAAPEEAVRYQIGMGVESLPHERSEWHRIEAFTVTVEVLRQRP